MARKKSESRKLAELIAKQRGIKLKSAQSWLRRVQTGAIKKPRFDSLSAYAAKKVRKAKREFKPTPRKEKVHIAVPVIETYSPFPANDRVSCQIYATFDFYGNDKRHRKINLLIDGKAANAVMNAESDNQIAGILSKTPQGGFLIGAELYEIDYITVSSMTTGIQFTGPEWS